MRPELPPLTQFSLMRSGLEVEAKGWFEGVMVEWNGHHIRPVFYDPVRLGQEIADTFARGEAYFREPNPIVVQATTRDHMQTAVEGLSDEELERLVSGPRPGAT